MGVFTYGDGILLAGYSIPLLYVLVGAGGATLLAIMGGYALAKFRFPGRKAVFAIIIGSISVPGIALAVPQFLLFAKLGLTNTPWAMLIPSLISPFGLYLMWIFSEQPVPTELLEAARVLMVPVSGILSGRFPPLLSPGIVTTALFTIVATWNNHFLPMIMIKDPNWWSINHWFEPVEESGCNIGWCAYSASGYYGIFAHDYSSRYRFPLLAKVLAVRFGVQVL